jgi:EAL domain-containing protein (putative c-di-GMP-specific phosphodiesterase class I)
MDNPVMTLDLLTRLRMKGFQLSIDDFGTGYSSMLQLVRLPFSEIKVDKSFVTTATRSTESRVVVESIIALGSSLGLRVVAEGVEDAETMQYLREAQCDLAQGYFIARPMPGEAVWEWLENDAQRSHRGGAQRPLL